MNAYQDHAAMLDALQTEQDNGTLEFQWNNASWAILPGGAKFKRANDIGGLKLESDLQLSVTTTQFNGTPPDSSDTFFYLGKQYLVVAYTTMPEGYQARINADLVVAGM